MIWARTSGDRGVNFCEIGTEVLERSKLGWIFSVSIVRTASISAVVL